MWEKRNLVAAGSAAALAVLISCAALTRWDAGEPANLPSVSAVAPGVPAVAPREGEPWSDKLGILGPAKVRTFYQYVDERGLVIFSDSLDQVPEEWRDRAGRVELDVPPPASPAASRMMRKLRSARDAAAPLP